jgi:hypothetical protein
MIKRGVGTACTDDGPRSFIINQIPGFFEKVTSPDYLRPFAEHYFENESNKIEIMQIFEKSLSSEEFRKDLQNIKELTLDTMLEEDVFYSVESSLRILLTIYHQSAELQVYSYPEDANLE